MHHADWLNAAARTYVRQSFEEISERAGFSIFDTENAKQASVRRQKDW